MFGEDIAQYDPVAAIRQVQQQIDLLYEIVTRCIPRKTFQAAVNAIKDEQVKQQVAPAADPRVDELVNRVNSLQDHLPSLIAQAIQQSMSVDKPHRTGRGKPKDKNPDMDFGEEQTDGSE